MVVGNVGVETLLTVRWDQGKTQRAFRESRSHRLDFLDESQHEISRPKGLPALRRILWRGPGKAAIEPMNFDAGVMKDVEGDFLHLGQGFGRNMDTVLDSHSDLGTGPRFGACWPLRQKGAETQ